MDLSKKREETVQYLESLDVIGTPEIKHALLKVKREDFVPAGLRESVYEYNVPVPIPGGVTMSAMNMHAIFMSSMHLKIGDKVLEIGAGSGVMLAYIKEVVGKKSKVYGLEIIPETYEFAKENLKKTGYDKKVKLILGDGSLGLPKYAPFDKILSSASSPPEIPKPWIDQLKSGGIILTPVGSAYGYQELYSFTKTKEGKLIKEPLGGVVFVNLVGKHGWK
jgi:protein-L-isoaspartate(D-aspartate) O-methyltransferase